MSVAPTFEVLSGLASIWRRGLSPDKIVDALKVNSGNRSFPNNTMVVNGFTAREGEWLAPDSAGKWAYASDMDRIARPLWQDPQERWDSEGGVTILQGSPGSGKTGFAAQLVTRCAKMDLPCYIVAAVPRNAERTVALRKLLEAKDAAVRANVN